MEYLVMTRLPLRYIHAFRDRHGKARYYLRRRGSKLVPLPGLPGSNEFMAAYQTALEDVCVPQKMAQNRLIGGTLSALTTAYLDCSPDSTSPFKSLAPETQRTRRNILENLRDLHGDKRVYRTDRNGQRELLLTRSHVQRLVNKKNNTPFAQRNLLNTLRALFKWAAAEDRVPDDPTLGVTRQKVESTGYRTWSEEEIAQYQRQHPLGTMARLALELLLATAARRGDVISLGAKNVVDGVITFVQAKTKGREESAIAIPVLPDLSEALRAMPGAKVVSLNDAVTFLMTCSGRPFKSAASFGNWFRTAAMRPTFRMA
jgi:integrase